MDVSSFLSPCLLIIITMKHFLPHIKWIWSVYMHLNELYIVNDVLGFHFYYRSIQKQKQHKNNVVLLLWFFTVYGNENNMFSRITLERMLHFCWGFLHFLIQSFLFPYFHLWLFANIVVQDTRQVYLWRWRNRPFFYCYSGLERAFSVFERSAVIHFQEHNITVESRKPAEVSSLFIVSLCSHRHPIIKVY